MKKALLTLALVASASVFPCDMQDKNGCGPVVEPISTPVLLACQDMDERAGCGPVVEPTPEPVQVACDIKDENGCLPGLKVACIDPSCQIASTEVACNEPGCQITAPVTVACNNPSCQITAPVNLACENPSCGFRFETSAA